MKMNHWKRQYLS